ncbi:MAG TPA: hypothetical protein VK509_05815 [Polyangiales bacterium]|nr:hypothetical protein [Polyangiales bacterium]
MTFDFQPHSPDRRQALAAGLLLMVVMAGHTVLETARDSLFLARLPAAKLPWIYAAIAVASLLAAELNARARKRFARPLLGRSLLAGGIGSAFFFWLFRQGVDWAPQALYVWVAVNAALATAQFWLMVSESFTVLEAKQLFALISAGGMLGAMLGGALARSVAMNADDVWLLPLGSVLFLVAACAQAVMERKAARRERVTATAVEAYDPRPPRVHVRDLRSERYLQRLLALTLASAFAATLIDYVFKAEVARTLPPAELGSFFGTFNAALSGAALLAQLLLAPRLLGSSGIGRSLWPLPLALALGTLGVLLAPALWTVLLLRGADGSLRYSLYRSSLEVLYLPLSTRTRARWKVMVDVVGQRGGQALAAGAILGCIALGLEISGIALVVLAVAVAWLALASTMERRYIALFRAKVQAGALETRPEVPALDMRSLESLVASLGSADDDEVLATIEMLIEYKRAHVIPALLLYHPSPAVVVRALEVFASSKRTDFEGAARRLFEREDDEVRAAAMLALAGHMTPAELRDELGKALPQAARAAVLVALIARQLDESGESVREVLEGCAPDAAPATRLSFARAFRLQGNPCCGRFLPMLLENAEPALEVEVARVMLSLPNALHVSALIQLLHSRHARTTARDALVAIGDPALDALAVALDNPELPRDLRAHLPRSISRFGSARAADIMLDRIERESDGWVRFKLIRGLAQVRPFTQEPSRARRALALARANLVHAVHFMASRLANERDQQHDTRLSTPGGELLTAALRDKESHAVDRAVRLLGLLHNGDVFHNIRQALVSRDPRQRADAIELLLHPAPSEIAQALSALLQHGRDDARLERAAAALDEVVATDSYQRRLELMLTDNSEAVRAVAGYHMAELGLRVPAPGQAQTLELSPLRARAGELFDQLRAGARRPEPAS